jgi:2-polyprenyl-3-methyl-5-hydroxy-6-metoxy-1,4-benzoquinol methylase
MRALQKRPRVTSIRRGPVRFRVPDPRGFMAKFGERRLYTRSALHRLQYRLTGVLDPAHYLHHRYVASMLGRHPNGRLREILDAGCGGGDHTFYLARQYADAAVLGIDRNSESIQRNAEVADHLGISNVRFEVGDLTSLPFESRFDLAICIDVLEHIPNQTGVLRNLVWYRRGDCSFTCP